MGSKWALVASFALAILTAGEVQAQTATQWDRKAEPVEGRPSEYRTTTTETWIRLTPYVGYLMWDRGLLMRDGPTFGLRLEFEPADVLVASLDCSSNLPFAHGWGCERILTEGRNGTDGETPGGEQRVLGVAVHPAIYVGLKNPEIKLGIMQPILGLGLGAWYLTGYDTGGGDPVNVSAANGGGVSPVKFQDSWAVHSTIFLRFDFDISTHVKFGIDLKTHYLFYTTKEFLGNMIPDKFRLDNLHFAFEPNVYFSIAF